MFSWIAGPRLSNAIEDLQPETNFETTFIEPPETPAHHFAVNAFKHAFFGTPAPGDVTNASKRTETKVTIDKANKTMKAIDLPAPKEELPPISPSKQPGGILMTPGTVGKGRKTVSFGSQVLDNESKRSNIGKSGIPNDCPGKFPSPWTPGTQLKPEPSSDKRPRTKLTEALLDARTTTQPKSGQQQKARDDSDITIDLGAPRSESGKYWKEQYESYAERSEKELKKIIAKQQLAKKYAMKKDSEVVELVTKLEQERKQHRQREKDLELQNKDVKELLQNATAQNTSYGIEIASLRARIATLEASKTVAPESQSTKPYFHIYEDAGIAAAQNQAQAAKEDLSIVPSLSLASSGKENTPTPRPVRRQSMPQSSNRPNLSVRRTTTENEESIILGKSPRRMTRSSKTLSEQPSIATPNGSPAKLPRSASKPDFSKAAVDPCSPVPILPSSPLPVASPDPWMEVDGSPIQQLDRMALPISTGVPYTRPEWNPPPKQPRTARSNANTRRTQPSTSVRKRDPFAESHKDNHDNTVHDRELSTKETPALAQATQNAEVTNDLKPVMQTLSTDPMCDPSKTTSHHTTGAAQVEHGNDAPLTEERAQRERKELARKRLAERKKQRDTAGL